MLCPFVREGRWIPLGLRWGCVEVEDSGGEGREFDVVLTGAIAEG